MTMARAITEMSPDGVRMTMNHLSRVEDLSKEESLRFARQIQKWFGGAGDSFPDAAGQVLARRNPTR
jgi:hypothetical protein